MFEDLKYWVKVLGDETHCSRCKQPLPTMDWQCCDLCPIPVCDKCDICANCNIGDDTSDDLDDDADACPGCHAPGEGGLCFDCRRED